MIGDGWEGTQRDSFDPTEDRRVRADPQRQAKNCQQRKPRIPPQHAKTKAEVLNQIFDEIYFACLPALLLDLRQAAQRSQRGMPGLFRVHPLGDIVIDLLLQMKLDLFAQLLFRLFSAKQ